MKIWIPRLIMAAFAAVLIYTVFWGYQQTQSETEAPAADAHTLQDTERLIIRGFNHYAEDMYRIISHRMESGTNRFISPYSSAAALAMLQSGASGQAALELNRLLHLPDLSKGELGPALFNIHKATIRDTKETELLVGNSMWLREGYPFNPDFLLYNKEYLQAELQTVNFSRSSASDTINRWVRQKTKGRVDGIVQPQIDSNVVSILLNTIYFRGQWATPFDPAHTKEIAFNLDNGEQKLVPMMNIRGSFPYYESEDVQAVRLPYADGRLNMTVYVPGNNKSSLKELEQWLLDQQGLENVRFSFNEKQGSIGIPRFRLGFGLDLKEALQELNLKSIFDSTDLGLNTILDSSEWNNNPGLEQLGNLFVSSVLHKTYLQINENGTEAAVATSVEVMVGSAEPVSPFEFIADRPFFFTIEDQDTGLILFMGTIYEPVS